MRPCQSEQKNQQCLYDIGFWETSKLEITVMSLRIAMGATYVILKSNEVIFEQFNVSCMVTAVSI